MSDIDPAVVADEIAALILGHAGLSELPPVEEVRSHLATLEPSTQVAIRYGLDETSWALSRRGETPDWLRDKVDSHTRRFGQ